MTYKASCPQMWFDIVHTFGAPKWHCYHQQKKKSSLRKKQRTCSTRASNYIPRHCERRTKLRAHRRSLTFGSLFEHRKVTVVTFTLCFGHPESCQYSGVKQQHKLCRCFPGHLFTFAETKNLFFAWQADRHFLKPEKHCVFIIQIVKSR